MTTSRGRPEITRAQIGADPTDAARAVSGNRDERDRTRDSLWPAASPGLYRRRSQQSTHSAGSRSGLIPCSMHVR